MSLTTSETKTKKSALRWARRAVLGAFALIGFFAIAAIAIPMLVDVNKYRPQLLEKVNSEINGRLEIGKLSLSLWGRVHVAIDGLRLIDASRRAVVDVRDASFNLPFWTLLTGHPELRLELRSPAIQIVKEQDGKLNVMKIAKGKAEAANGAATGAATGKPGSSGALAVPGIALRSRFTLLLHKADLSYKDEATGDAYKVGDLDFALNDVSPSSQMPFEISAVLDIAMKNQARVSGPVALAGLVKGESAGSSFEKAIFNATLKLDQALISSPGILEKKPGVPLNFALDGTATASGVNISSFKFRLAEILLDGALSVETKGEATRIDLKAKSNAVELSSLSEVSPPAKAYNLSGTLSVDARASGPLSQLGYSADLKLSRVKLDSSAAMKQPLELDAAIAVATNELKNILIKLSAKNFDLTLTGALQDFAAPRFRLSAKSNEMDLDGLLKSSAAAAERRGDEVKTASSGADSKSAGEATAAPVMDYNAMFKPLRENRAAAAANGSLELDLKKVKTTGVVMENVKGELLLEQLLLQLKYFSMQLFEGTVAGQASFNAKAAKPDVAASLTVSGLQTKSMVASQMPFAKNTIQGALSATLNLGGPGLNFSDITSAWKGSGNLGIKNAVFSTLDFGKQVKEGAIAKLPGILKSKIHLSDRLADWKGEYDSVDVKYALASGVLTIPEIVGKAHPSKGMDLRGSGKTALRGYALDLNLDLIDTYDLLGAESFAKDDRYGKFALSAKVGGTLFSPKFDWSATVSRLAQGAAKQQAKQALEKALPKGLPGGAKPAEAVKGLMKGLFGR